MATHKNHSAVAASIAEKIFKALAGTPGSMKSEVIKLTSSFLKNMGAMAEAVISLGYGLLGFRSTEVLEFYFDVELDNRYHGYVSKGWDDPGVRVGELMYIDKRFVRKFNESVKQIMDACTSQGISFYYRPDEKCGVILELWTPVYGEQISVSNLKNAFDALHECLKRLRKICPVTRVLYDDKDIYRSN